MEKAKIVGIILTLLLIGTLASTLNILSSEAEETMHIGSDAIGPLGLVATEWNKTYGGSKDDSAFSVVQTSDGGYAIAGRTNYSGSGGYGDFWLVKTDSSGVMQWNKTYGGSNYDFAYSVVQTGDGGYAIAGLTQSFGAGGGDFWLVKTDSSGNKQWNKTYGGLMDEIAYSVVQTGDGGYAVAGYTNSFGAGQYDFWLVKTDSSGVMQWNRTYGRYNYEIAYSMVKTGDGGYAVAGYTNSFGVVDDFWLVKTDSSGVMQWNGTYGGSSAEGSNSVVQTGDGGYAVAGYTNSFGAGQYDFWLVKTDSSGNKQWNKTYGGSNNDFARSVVQTSDGGYAVAGYTKSFGAGLYNDFWLVRTDSSGVMQWNRTYGNSYNDAAYSVVQTSDGGYAIAGDTWSFAAGSDFWLVKLTPSTIYIRADGSVDPPTAPIQRNGDLYTFTDNIYTVVDGIVIQKDNIVLNGQGHILQGYGNTGIYLTGRTNVTIENMSIKQFYIGIYLYDSTWNRIIGNTIDVDNSEGFCIRLGSASFNTLAGNNVTAGCASGICLSSSNNNTITANRIENKANCQYGCEIESSENNYLSYNTITKCNSACVCLFSDPPENNTIACNNLTDSYRGIQCSSASWNFVFHNNFVNNSIQASLSESNLIWDEGYPSGGNYWGLSWSGYNGTDIRRGPSQNETGSDGIADSPYFINADNQDRYPLMQPWTARSTQYPWTMFRQNLMRTGYTESPAPKTNQKKWSYTTGSFVESSPAVVNGKVYVGSWDNNTYCLDALTGTQIWNYTTGNHVVTSSPAVVDGRVYVGSEDRNLHCLDALTGTQIWNYTTGNYVCSSPAVVDGRVYVGSGDGKVYCLDALTGTRIWNYTTGTYVESSPAVVDGRVYIGSDDYNVYCLDALTGTRIWNYTTGNPVRSCPAVVDGRVYVGSIDCNVYCLDALTGTRIWSYLTGIPGIRSSPAVADGRVYVGSLDHNIYCLDALTGTSIWNYTTGMAVLSSPAIADGKVYIGSCDNKTYCLDASTGAQIWNYTTGNWVTSSPAIADGMLFIGSYDGAVYAIGDVVRVPEDYPTIQAAINAASPGDTVMVAPGVYHECLTINKPLTLLGERGSDTTFEGGGSGIAITLLPGASGTIIAGVVITNYNQGILVVNANNCKIYDTIMSLSSNGIALQGSNAANNNIYSNIFQNNAVAVNLTASSTSNTFYKNIIISNVRAGINLQSDGNIIYANTISGNPCGINVTASNNLIYHNNFIDNTVQASVTSSGNMWNDSYPSGGNYWSDYAGVDNYRGPSQTLPGSDSIGDTGYTIAVNNMDRYPLMKPFNPHDIGITGLYTSKTVVGQGYCMNMILRILNYGMYDEAFAVRCYANTTIMANQPFALTSKNSTAITLTWNTTGFVKGNYTLSAYAWPVQGETDTSDNTLTDGLVYVGVPGDVDGNHKVDIKDILMLAKAYGTNPQSPNWNPNLDINSDDKVDIRDILIAAKNYGKTDP